MGLKDSWRGSSAPVGGAVFGPNTPAIEILLGEARTLARGQIVRLDLQERRDPERLLAAWDHLRDRLANEPQCAWRIAAGDAAWETVRLGAAALEISVPAGDDCWRVQTGIGFGAARAARFAACALVAPEALDPELLEFLLQPWRDVVGLPVVAPLR